VAGLETPTGGRVIFEEAPPGVPLTGVVFQEHALFPWRTVRDNVTFGLEVRGVPPAERDAAARRLLQLVGLAAFADRYPHHLSGGMRQRVAIARALPSSRAPHDPLGTDPLIVKAARSLRAERWQVVLKVVLPSALPRILAGYRLRAGIALLLVVSAEMINATAGIGFLILHSGDLLLTGKWGSRPCRSSGSSAPGPSGTWRPGSRRGGRRRGVSLWFGAHRALC
jgi:hypothetical protein